MAESFAGIMVGTELIIADAILGEQYIHSSQASVYPVEGGQFNTDGVLQFPDVFVMDLIISDDPIPRNTPTKNTQRAGEDRGIEWDEFQYSFPRPRGQLSNVNNLVGEAITAGLEGNTVEFAAIGPRVKEMRTRKIYERLVQVHKQRELVTVGMTLGQFAECVITRIEVRRDRPVASIIVSVEFQRVRFAQVQFTTAREVDRPRAQTSSNAAAGKTEVPPDAPKAKALRSGLSSLSSLFGG